jgi:periplasmic divalent cation tolerance protein
MPSTPVVDRQAECLERSAIVQVLVAFTTSPSEEHAVQLARLMVEEKLAACVQILPDITSFYMWEGKLERAAERLILIKTTRERLEEMIARIESLHPYDVPEIIAVEAVGGLDKYLQWVVSETRR